jgi:hypothetical protein
MYANYGFAITRPFVSTQMHKAIAISWRIHVALPTQARMLLQNDAKGVG